MAKTPEETILAHENNADANSETGIERHFVEIAGLKIFYQTAGNKGIPTLLIHGGGSDSSEFAWKHIIGKLGNNRRVIAIDLPGYGKSQMPSLNSMQNPFLYHIEFIGTFLKEMQIHKSNLVGISMGGGISLGAALAHPELIEKLVLVDSYGLGKKMIGGISTYLASRTPYFNEVLRFILQKNRWAVKAGLKNLVYNPDLVTDAFVDEAWQALRSARMHPAWKAFQKHEVTISGYRTDFREQFPGINKPVLIIHGKNDKLIPLEGAISAHQDIPGSQLITLENCGHLPPREVPDRFVDILNKFL